MAIEINLLKNNDNKELSDIEWVKEFFDYLKENEKLNPTKAFRIIYYLQEHFSILPDHIEKCDICGVLYDSDSEGHRSDKTNQFYCDECIEYCDDEEDFND